MGDVFKEQIVKRQNTAKDTAIKICAWVLAVVLLFLSFVAGLGSVAPIIVLVLFFCVKFATSYLNVEYEYAFTSGELDIDVIYDRSRRKRVFSADIKSVEIMAHINDRNHEGKFSGVQGILDYSSGTPGPNTYAFLAIKDGKKVKVIIEPNDKMLKAFSSVLTRRNLHLAPGVVLI